MKDFLGKELEVGDRIVYMQAGYKEFKKATVVGFSPKKKKKKVRFKPDHLEFRSDREIQNRFGNEIIKIG
ncbi:hypothetical protein [Salmonella phage SSBI34]|nr:hypothetical protein [Salmonella phage SSBI34]